MVINLWQRKTGDFPEFLMAIGRGGWTQIYDHLWLFMAVENMGRWWSTPEFLSVGNIVLQHSANYAMEEGYSESQFLSDDQQRQQWETQLRLLQRHWDHL